MVALVDTQFSRLDHRARKPGIMFAKMEGRRIVATTNEGVRSQLSLSAQNQPPKGASKPATF